MEYDKEIELKSHTLIINSCYSVNVYIINRSPKTVIKRMIERLKIFLVLEN